MFGVNTTRTGNYIPIAFRKAIAQGTGSVSVVGKIPDTFWKVVDPA